MPPVDAARLDALELLMTQLDAIGARAADLSASIDRAARAEQEAASRDARLVSARSLAVLRAEQLALQRLSEQRWRDGEPWRPHDGPRVVLAHRQPWFLSRVGKELTERGAHVIARCDDGAEAAASLVLDQPDLILLEDSLPHLNAAELRARAQAYAPRTFVVVQAQGPTLAEPGQYAVLDQRLTPPELAEKALALIAS